MIHYQTGCDLKSYTYQRKGDVLARLDIEVHVLDIVVIVRTTEGGSESRVSKSEPEFSPHEGMMWMVSLMHF